MIMEENENNIITDIDNNEYNTVVIGKQTWIKENLNVTRYRNGDIIPEVRDYNEWSKLTTGVWCYYDNKPGSYQLYNWYAVNDSRGLAPLGWHIPCDDEWEDLVQFLGGSDVAGQKMKGGEFDFCFWIDNNNEKSNSSGFTGVASGIRYEDGDFDFKFEVGHFWSTSENELIDNNIITAYGRALFGNSEKAFLSSKKINCGLAIRCVKDQ